MIQGDQDALGHPWRPCQAQPLGVQKFYNSKTNRFKVVPGKWIQSSEKPKSKNTKRRIVQNSEYTKRRI